MLKNFLITGDTHSKVAERLERIKTFAPEYVPEETGIIILGDAGFNYWLNNTDKKNKEKSAAFGYTIYCLRGNHEERPENLGYDLETDENVGGLVYADPHCSNIKYLLDGNIYQINGFKCLAIGGAYSVDKWYRLQRAAMNGQSFSGWFEDEQLNDWEKNAIFNQIKGEHFEFVFPHTAPFSWEPTDLFLSGIDQSHVDKSMEEWLEEVKNNIYWDTWCFGHYHADRLEMPYVEQYYHNFESIDNIYKRWSEYAIGNNEPLKYFAKGPKFIE